jgi:negative regulator of sigma F NrsF-like protein
MNHSLPSEDLKLRLLREVESTPSSPRPLESKRTAWLVAIALLASFSVFLVFGGVRLTGRPPSLVLGTVIGTATIAALAIWAMIGRGRAMMGRASSWLTAVAIASPLGLLVWKVLWSAQFENGLDAWERRPGFRCLGLGLAMGALPLAAMLFGRRGTDAVHPGRAGMAIGIGVGLGAATLVDAWCPVAYVPHLLLGHLLPLALLGAVGFWLGRKILAP